MDIYNSGGTLILSVIVDDNSYRHRTIMGEHNLTLHYSLASHVEIPVGSYCSYQGQIYTLKRPENFKMKHTRNFEYTVLFESAQADAKIWKFRNTVDGRLKFSLTAKPHEHLEMFVANMNRRSSGWTVGECIDDVEHCINYDHDFCWDALGKIASEFNTEFEIVDKTVRLRKVEYNKANPLALSYGKGNGFRSGVGRTSSDTPPIQYLFVQGGTQNIDPSKYGNQTLLLPKLKTISYDGERFEDEVGYVSANARTYQTDAQGLYIYRINSSSLLHAEESLDCSESYPRRVGTVSSVVLVNAEKHFYDIVDSSIPSTLNFAECQIGGEKMTIEFQSGMLAGHGEFEVNYFHNAVNGKSARRFEIVPKEEDGVTMPNNTYKPVAGDKYSVFKIMLPQAYIADDTSKTGAEWDMFRTAVKYMFDNEEEKFTFTGELDGIWASTDWETIGGKIVLGGFVLFSDTVFQPQGVLVRITGIKDFINKPHKPEIELSNKTVTSGFRSELKTLEAQEVLVEDSHKDAIDFTKRRFRDAQETMQMLNDLINAGFDNFSGNINPITVQTMQLMVGDERLQFRFVTSPANPQAVNHYFAFNSTTKKFVTDSGIIQHMTLGIKTLSSSHANSEYKYWNVSSFESAVLSDVSIQYYLYIRASKTTTDATFKLSQQAIAMESESGYYHFLVGILNSEYENYRSFAPLYGYTEILPSRITTDKVVSGNGNSYFDMLANAMKLGTALDFNSQGDGKLRIKGTLVQSQGGDAENVIGCYRGAFDYDTTYYNGDEVTYTSNGCTSTYRYIYPTPVSGVFPVNTTYWEVTAKGAQGPSGISPNTAFKSIVFKRSNTAVSRPTGGSYSSPVPSGWSDGVPSGEAKLWMSTRIFSSDGLSPQESQWTAPRQMTDTADIDIEYSSVENPSAPSGHPNTNTEWSDTADETTIWMATSKKSNGVWGNWEVSRIKGERGSDGTSVSVKGTSYNHFSTVADWTEEVTTAEPLVLIDSAEVDGETVYNVIKKYGRPHAGSAPGWMTRYADVGDGYVMESDGHLWMADTDGWKDIGQFRGQTGATGAAGQNAYLHIKYAKSTTTNDWSDNNGETPDAYIGTYADNNPTDQLVWSLYTWKKWQGEDGFGYEYIFKKTQTETAPSTPTSTSQSDNYVPSGWTDDPSGTSEEYPYEWICYRKKTYGVWGAFIGSDADHTKAALHSKYGKDGNFYEYRYKVTGSPSETPSLTNNVREPSGWATSYTAPAALQYLWRTVALINGKTNALIGTWSTPVRETPVDAVNVGENLVDNSEEQETFDIVESGPYNDSTPPSQFGTTTKRLYRIPRNGTKISCQVRVTLQGCSFKSGGGSVLVYMNGTAAWPAVGQKTGITANGTYDLKNENFTLDYNGGTMYNAINVRFNNFNAGGTVTIELVKVEEGASCTAWCLSEADKSGPAPIFRSTYDSSKTYIGTRHRVDVVKYNGSHYVTRTDIGSVTGVVPTNKQYWNDFGGQFESIATGLLLAELANIAGFIFKNNKLISQKGTKNGAESTDYSAANFIPNLILDGVNGDGVFRGIVHASLMYSNVKVVTTSMTPYHIDPAQEPFNWFFINQNMSQIWLYLPHSSDYDGLEINILQKHTNWLSDSRDVRLRVDSGDTLYAKYFSDEVYANYHTFQGPNSVQLCLNTHYVVKAINGAWYIIFGAVSGW